MKRSLRPILGLAVTITTLILMLCCSPSGTQPTPPPTTTYIESGTTIASGLCTLLEGWTSNQTVISLCASLDEVAIIATFIASFLRHGEHADAGAVCTIIPKTTLCATKREIGDAISFILQKRRAYFVLALDASTP